ncbi:MAG: NAD(P)H-binding protein, partial [Anaerolineae bacterium]|nr:NAD(P)H-binding protein [Anaerolineae bacterium]
MNNRILITGATGRVGADILRQLPAGSVIRAGVRQPEEARKKLKRTDVEYVPLDFEQPATFAPALEGVTRVFLMWPAVKTDYVMQFIAAAEQAQVQQVVFLSIIVAEQLPFLSHRKVEKRLEASSMSYTFL